MNFEGSELCYYINGESYSIPLSVVQFTMITKLLGLKVCEDGAYECFSDETLKRLAQMKGNPLKLKEESRHR